MSVASTELVRWLAGIRRQVQETNPAFAQLDPVGWPIPFFGDIRTARVLTVGVNPSSQEFAPPTRWATVTRDAEWVHRLLDYFQGTSPPPNKWFLPWEASLKLIGCSYEDRTAAHLDLSPRATIRMTDAPRQRFCDMVQTDVRWFFESLAFAPCARLVLVAGGIIKPEENAWLPIGSYIESRAEHHAARVESGAGMARIVSDDGCVSLPMFSFSNGPAAQDKFKLIQDVFVTRKGLLPYLA